MNRSHSLAWILVFLLSLTLAAPLQASITPSGDVDPTGLDWWLGGGSSSASAYIGKTAIGSVTVNFGSDLSSYWGYIGRYPGSDGVVTIDGNDSTWTNSQNLCVGDEGEGTLNITNGGEVSNNYGYVSFWNDSIGVVTVDGNDSTWTNSCSLYVGRYGHGTLDITTGGNVNVNYHGYIGYGSDSTGVVTVADGSTWTNDDNLYVGIYGQGTLDITTGGDVSNSTGCIGYLFGSTGEVTVGGNGSTWTNSASLYVGGYHDASGGTGELTVSVGGSVEVGETLKIWGPGTLNVGATGKVTVGEALVLVQDSTLTAEAGATIHMTGSAFENANANSAKLAGLGNLTLIFEGGAADVDPFEAGGEDVGATIGGFVTANFLLDTLQLGGTAAGKIQLVDDFDNQADGSGVGEAVYVNTLIMNAGATIDRNGLNLYYLNDGDPKEFFYGDATLDGYIDGSDLDILLADWGKSVPPADPRADLSGDSFVDGDDLDLILSDWGKGVPPPVPEPVSATLLLLGAVAILKRRRKCVGWDEAERSPTFHGSR